MPVAATAAICWRPNQTASRSRTYLFVLYVTSFRAFAVIARSIPYFQPDYLSHLFPGDMVFGRCLNLRLNGALLGYDLS